MINFMALEKEMKKIDSKVNDMVKQETSEPEKKPLFKIKGNDVFSENEDSIENMKRLKMNSRLLAKDLDGITGNAKKKMGKKVNKPEVGEIDIENITCYQKDGIDSFSIRFDSDGVKCDVSVSYNEKKPEPAVSYSVFKESVYYEKSHGKLTKDFRKGYDYDTGHALKIVYDLKGIDIKNLGDAYAHTSGRTSTKEREEDLNDVRKNISKKGNTDHNSSNQVVVAIIDRVTNTQLKTARVIGPYAPAVNTDVLKISKSQLDSIHKFYNDKGSEFTNKYVVRLTVGQKDTTTSFKSTHWFKKDTKEEDYDGFKVKSDNTRSRGQNSESLKYGRGEKLNDISDKEISSVGTPVKYNTPSKKDVNKNPDAYKKESSEEIEEYGSADLGDMLPQVPVSEPVLTKDAALKEDSDEENPDITDDDEREADESRAHTEFIRADMTAKAHDELEQESASLMESDPISAYMLMPVLESPFDLTYGIKQMANNRLLRAYWEMAVLKAAIKLHSKYNKFISENLLYDLKKKLVVKEKNFNTLNVTVKGSERGKMDFAMKSVDNIINRKMKDIDHVLQTKVSEINTKVDETRRNKNTYKSIDKMYSSFIRKAMNDKMYLKKYLANVKNFIESSISQYEDSPLNTILESCVTKFNVIEKIYENHPAMNSFIYPHEEIHIEESVFDQYETIMNAFMVTMESMKEMINLNRYEDDSAVEILENAYNSICGSAAEMNLYIESCEEEAYQEAADMEEEIRPIVAMLNSKGYKVKYANPGHLNFKSDRDAKRDGILYNKIYSDAHIQFDGNYGIKAPENWNFRTTETGDYLDVKEPQYDKASRAKEDINKLRREYKEEYMKSLREWAKNLPEFKSNNTEKESDVKESVDFDDIFESFM